MLKVEDFNLPEELERYTEALREVTNAELEELALKLEKHALRCWTALTALAQKTLGLLAQLVPVLADTDGVDQIPQLHSLCGPRFEWHLADALSIRYRREKKGSGLPKSLWRERVILHFP